MKSEFESVIKLLGLTKNEKIVLSLLDEHNNPVSIAKKCKIPRATVYVTLEKLEKRGLIKQRKRLNKKHWEREQEEIIEKTILNVSKYLNFQEDIKNKISLKDKTHIIIYRGEEEIMNQFSKMITQHSGERMLSLSGVMSGVAWGSLISSSNIDEMNKLIKDEKMITELVTSKQWFMEQINLFGNDWAKGFEGRTAVFNKIANEYLQYSSQLFILEDQVYLVSMQEGVFIEIKNSEIAKLILSMVRFIQDHSEILDGNAFLREVIKE